MVRTARLSRSHTILVAPVLSFSLSLSLVISACGGQTLPAGAQGPAAMPDAGTGTGPGGMKPPPPPPGMGMGPGMGPGMGTIGTTVVGVPTVGPPKVVWTGGGPAGLTPLAPGCTPASALECPTVSGTCATSATSHATGTQSGSICFYPTSGNTTGTTTTTTTSSTPAATLEYLHETAGGQEYYRFRVTFDPNFADNTYGTNAIAWGQRGHTFMDLVGSDHLELQVFDGGSTLVLDVNLDYISVVTSAPCGYAALGVSGQEGKVLLGDAKYILGATTSMARDLSGCGYCSNAACGGSCLVNSPVTDGAFSANASAPNWDYRVQYEVWVDAAVFAGKGFGGANVPYVHASPSKVSSNTIIVTPKPCPSGGGGGCATGTVDYLTSEGKQTCVPTPSGGGCPAGYTNYLLSEGAVCVPTPNGGTCPAGYQVDPVSEGSRCI